MDFSNLLKFTITSLTSHFHEAGRFTFQNEAPAFRQMEDFAEPLQTLFFTLAASIREL